MDRPPVILVEGERVALGPLRRDLVSTYATWDGDLELSALRGRDLRPRSELEWERTVDAEPGDGTRVFFTVYETVYEHKAPRPIGVAMLLQVDSGHRTADFGIYLGERDTWSTGVGTEATRLALDFAFHALGMHNVLLRVIAENGRAIKAYERAGFKVVGRRRESFRLGQRVFDDVYMDCLAHEFESPVVKRLWERVFGA